MNTKPAVCQKITIDGNEYVLTAPQSKPSNVSIVRTQSAGVFMGEIVSRNGQEVEMRNVRRLWYWEGAASLSQLAMEGVSKPGKCKFPCPVTSITLPQAVEILQCTEAAVANVNAVPIWQS